MGLGSFFKSVFKTPKISTGLGGWADLAVNLYMYKKRRDAMKKRVQNQTQTEHIKRMEQARKQLGTLTQNYHRGGVKMTGTPSIALNALERKNISEIDGYLNGRLRQVKNMRSQTHKTMLGMILKQHRRKWF